MAKETIPSEAPAPDAAEPISLEDFCMAESRKARQVEMLGAFYAEEKAASRMFDAAASYAERYTAFANRPSL